MPTIPSTMLLPPEVHAGGRSFTRPELAELASARRMRTAATRGEIVAVLPGRWASTAHSQSLTVRAHAAAGATTGVVTAAAALFVAGALERPPRFVSVSAPAGKSMAAPGWLRITRARREPPAFAWRGIRVALPEFAVIDAWADPTNDGRKSMVLSALQSGVAPRDMVVEAAARRTRIRDRAGLAAVIDGFDRGAQSFLEYEGLTRVFRGREFARFVRQHDVSARGHRYRLDMYDPETRTAVELDGAAFHAAGERREADNRRDADLATLGIVTLRLGYSDVMDRPAWCQATVLAVLRARARG